MKGHRFIYWAPRIMAILFIAFLALFSLDVFESEQGIGNILIGLIMHNIPAISLLVVLIIAWRIEIVGGIVFVLAAIGYIVMTISNAEIPWYLVISWSLTISGPALLTGILFFICWFKKMKIKRFGKGM